MEGAPTHSGPHSLQIRRLDQSLDHSCVGGHDGEDHTGQEDQSQLVDIPAEDSCQCVCVRVCVCMGF